MTRWRSSRRQHLIRLSLRAQQNNPELFRGGTDFACSHEALARSAQRRRPPLRVCNALKAGTTISITGYNSSKCSLHPLVELCFGYNMRRQTERSRRDQIKNQLLELLHRRSLIKRKFADFGWGPMMRRRVCCVDIKVA